MGRHVTDSTQAALSKSTGGLRGPGLFQSRTKRLETHPSVSCSPPVTQYTEPEGIEKAIARSLFLFGRRVLCAWCNLALLKSHDLMFGVAVIINELS